MFLIKWNKKLVIISLARDDTQRVSLLRVFVGNETLPASVLSHRIT